MERKILISLISLAVAGSLFFLIWNILDNRREEIDENLEQNNEIINIANEEITDECTEEWEEQNQELQTAFEQASSNVTEDKIHYVLKNEGGFISVYYLNENNEELLYKKTDIAVDYLSEEDINDLETGIEVIGIEEVNKRLEDFE